MSPSQIRAARAALGLSTAALARALGLADGRVVRRWEAGDRSPDGPSALALAYLLDDAGLELPRWAESAIDAARAELLPGA